MSWKHVFSLFSKHDLYTQALEESHKMLDIALEMFDPSVESLRRYDDGTLPWTFMPWTSRSTASSATCAAR
jgi:hypothetical protein